MKGPLPAELFLPIGNHIAPKTELFTKQEL